MYFHLQLNKLGKFSLVLYNKSYVDLVFTTVEIVSVCDTRLRLGNIHFFFLSIINNAFLLQILSFFGACCSVPLLNTFNTP